ncbi:MAG: serine protease SohB [Paracoccaceae bacterium]|jgi:signal peptide peptidase SppA
MKLPSVIKRFVTRPPKVAVIRLHGVIGSAGRFSRGLSDQSLAPVIERAFASGPVAVALSINSPGGSPVQSSLIAGRIRRLADQNNVPVVAFVEDAAASGGYWLACAADEIYGDPASIVGSIGVIHASFGLQDLIARHGVQRRVHATGDNKAFLDPFQPEDPAQVNRLYDLLAQLQGVFTDHVRTRRGVRLDEAHEPLFDGRVWTAARATELGIIDGIAAMRPELERRFGKDLSIREYAPRKGLLSRFGGGGTAGAALAAGMIDAAEERVMWSRFGL